MRLYRTKSKWSMKDTHMSPTYSIGKNITVNVSALGNVLSHGRTLLRNWLVAMIIVKGENGTFNRFNFMIERSLKVGGRGQVK